MIGAATSVIGSGGALAQCISTSAGNAFIPFGTGAGVASIVSTMNAVTSGSLAQSTAFVGAPGGAAAGQQGGGVWQRTLGGSIETKGNTTTSGAGNFGAFNFAGTVGCETTTKQDFVGAQVGMDIGRLNFAGGGNMHWGVTAGYTDISTKDKTPGQGTFSAESQVPFGGFYMAITSGNWSIDAQVRGDFLHNELSDTNEGAFSQALEARSVAFLWNASYRFDLQRNWFVEPSIGGVSSWTQVDQFNTVGGIFLPAAATPSPSLPGVVKIDDINSLVGRVSLRAGTTIVGEKMAWQPFVTASLFHEFAGNVRTVIETNPAIGGNVNATSTTSRMGTFGHVGVGLAGVILNTGWVGYSRVDYRFGDNIDSLTFNSGLRYHFTPPKDLASASLKDSDYSEAASRNYSWTGLYLGVSAGGLAGDQDQAFSNGNTSHPKFEGYLLGGQLGYNHQLGSLVLGIEADWSVSNAEGGMACPNQNFFTCTAKVDSLALVTGRVGFALDRALYYVKGGLAIGEVETGYSLNGGGFVAGAPSAAISQTLTGWAFGAGMEFAITDKWSAKGEWVHYDLGDKTYNLPFPMTTSTRGDLARVGLNYHFGGRTTNYEHHEAYK